MEATLTKQQADGTATCNICGQEAHVGECVAPCGLCGRDHAGACDDDDSFPATLTGGIDADV